MRRVLPAELAELVHLDATRCRLLVFGCRIVTVLTITALQSNDFSHDPYFTFSNSCGVGINSCTSNPRDEKISANNILSRRESRSEEHTSELQSRFDLVCRLLL